MSDTAQPSTTNAESSRHEIAWNTAEQKIRKLARSAELTKEEAHRLYRLELSASRHSGESPGRLLKEAERILR
jgi:hypothetical protein